MSYFSADCRWVRDDECTRRLFGHEEIVFRAVKMGGIPIFILDYGFLNGEDRYCDRVLFGDFYDVSDFLMVNDPDSYKIALLMNRNKNKGEFYISDLVEVFSAEDEYGQKALIYQCKDGRRHVDSSIASKEEELANVKRIYSNTEHVSQW